MRTKLLRVVGLPVIEQLATEQLATEQLAIEHLATEQLAIEHLAIEHLATEQLAIEHLATEQLAIEQLAIEHLATEMLPAVRQPVIRLLVILLLTTMACDRGYTPKPAGYIRVHYPEKEYVMFDEPGPYTFEVPVYTDVVPAGSRSSEPYWYDVKFPEYRGTVHISYKPVDGDVEGYIEDTRTLVYKHASRADGILEVPFVDRDNRRYGILYELGGNVASPVQFFLTDSTDHFLRGSLYFNTTANRDSLNPIIRFVKQDIEHLIETVRWK